MAGGIAIFDYDNDGLLNAFFPDCAAVHSAVFPLLRNASRV
jgi:hypothetical protein